MQNKSRSFLVVFIALQIASCASYTSVRQHQNFQKRMPAVQTIGIVLPEVEIVKDSDAGKAIRQLHREPNKIAEIQIILSQALKQKGYTVKYLSSVQIGKENILKLRSSFNDAKNHLYAEKKTQKYNKSFLENMGELPVQIAQQHQVDALLLFKYFGYEKSKVQFVGELSNKVFLGFLTGYAPVSGKYSAKAETALVCGVTGNVLWANYAATPSLDNVLIENIIRPLMRKKDLTSH